MGESSRRKKEGREAKDPLRWLRATLEAKTMRMDQAAQVYHYCRAEVEKLTAKLTASSAELRASGHPLYQEGQDAPAAPTLDEMLLPVAPADPEAPVEQSATSVQEVYIDGPAPVADEDVVARDELGHGEAAPETAPAPEATASEESQNEANH